MTVVETLIQDRSGVTMPETPPVADELGIEDLRALMVVFNETTQRLQRTHGLLQREVTRLQRELNEANAQLRRSRSLAALGEMAAGIAHEIRNPLAAIRLNAQVLAEDLAEAPPQRELCEKIGGAVITLDAIVRDVLLFSRDTRVHPEPANAGELLDEAVRQCEVLIDEHDVRVERDYEDAASTGLEADRVLMVQAIGNVVRNAVEAMTDGSSATHVLRVSTRRRRERGADGSMHARVVVAVEDTGPGIPPEVVDRMFNPFFTTRRTGTGLGLAIVHRIVDAHGGHARVSRADSGGARVELCLPPTPDIQSPAEVLHEQDSDR